MSDKVTLVIRIDAGLINVNPETVEEALNKYFAPDGAVSVFYAAEQSVHWTRHTPRSKACHPKKLLVAQSRASNANR